MEQGYPFLIPCAFRPFYYISVDTLNIPEESGYEREVCIEAYDDVMNFIWEGAEFKTGQLKWTEEEKGHFEYGGSTIIVLVGKDRLKLREDLRENIGRDVEIPVVMGEKLGSRVDAE